LSKTSFTPSRPHNVTPGPILRKSHDPSGWGTRLYNFTYWIIYIH